MLTPIIWSKCLPPPGSGSQRNPHSHSLPPPPRPPVNLTAPNAVSVCLQLKVCCSPPPSFSILGLPRSRALYTRRLTQGCGVTGPNTGQCTDQSETWGWPCALPTTFPMYSVLPCTSNAFMVPWRAGDVSSLLVNSLSLGSQISAVHEGNAS